MANSYQVRLFNEAEGIDQTVEVPEDCYILETALFLSAGRLFDLHSEDD